MADPFSSEGASETFWSKTPVKVGIVVVLSTVIIVSLVVTLNVGGISITPQGGPNHVTKTAEVTLSTIQVTLTATGQKGHVTHYGDAYLGDFNMSHYDRDSSGFNRINESGKFFFFVEPNNTIDGIGSDGFFMLKGQSPECTWHAEVAFSFRITGYYDPGSGNATLRFDQTSPQVFTTTTTCPNNDPQVTTSEDTFQAPVFFGITLKLPGQSDMGGIVSVGSTTPLNGAGSTVTNNWWARMTLVDCQPCAW
jgi:hypothetical protein